MSVIRNNLESRNKLVGANKLEALMFSLGKDKRTGREETFGINVFKVLEVMRIPEITRAPDMPQGVEGMVSLRGKVMPVIDVAKFIGIETDDKPEIMIVTTYSNATQGFLVKAVDHILRLDWSDLHVPPAMLLAEMSGFVTAITELKDKRLIMMMDVEKVLADSSHIESDNALLQGVEPLDKMRKVFFVDDSSLARHQIALTLDALQVKYSSAINGLQAWTELLKLADHADAVSIPLKENLHLILTDVEMPEMDGYTLTRKIKSDKRFSGIPVLMHSSLSGIINQQLGREVGVDQYLPKFDQLKLAQTLEVLLN